MLLFLLQYWKSILGLISICILSFSMYTCGYDNAKEKYDKDILLFERNKENEELKSKLAEQERLLNIEKQNIKVITKYQTKKEIIEKEVPKIEKHVETIYVDKPIIYLDDDIVRLHDEYICNNQISESPSTCSVDGTTKESKSDKVTQEEFVKRVLNNYSIAFENQNKLLSLQEAIKEQQ